MPGTLKLKKPPRDFNSRGLNIIDVPPSRLYRISEHEGGEPYFGTKAKYRFDDRLQVFGTCYLGTSLKVAFAESVLHDAEPDANGFTVAKADIATRFAHTFSGKKLKLAKLYGDDLLLLGGNGELSGTYNYAVPQAWSKAVHDHPDNVDGFLFVSRRINNAFSVVLFDRCTQGRNAIKANKPFPLSHHPDFQDMVTDLRVSLK